MRRLIVAATLFAALSSTAWAADFQFKDSSSKGSNVGQASSAGSGNGAVVGGNGTIEGAPLSGWATDQTTSPGSRAALVQELQTAEGRGRANSNK